MSVLGSVISTPSKKIFPEVGSSRRFKHRRNVHEFIVLLKETSVAGYIAIQDLTKGADIIRSRTYSAFMPLT